MVSLWPSRGGGEPAGADDGPPGSIEMHGASKAASPPGKQPGRKFWGRRAPAMQPLGENAGTPRAAAAWEQLEHDFAATLVQANVPTRVSCSQRRLQVVTQGAAKGTGKAAPGHSLQLTVPEEGSDAAESQEFDEVQIVFRVPRAQPGNAPTDAQGRSLEELGEELAQKERLRQRAAASLATKAQECEDLLRIVRELTESRNRLAGVRAVQSERLADLQADYVRVARVADLSRSLSKENITKAAQAQQRLHQAEEELARQRLVNQQARERAARLKLENLELRERLSLLERLDVFAYRSESACMVKFQQCSLKETY